MAFHLAIALAFFVASCFSRERIGDAPTDPLSDRSPFLPPDSGPSTISKDGPAMSDVEPEKMTPDQFVLVPPEAVAPLDRSLFHPDNAGRFAPLTWTSAPGARNTTRLWRLPDPDANAADGEIVFDEPADGNEASPVLDYRTDYAWEVTSCAPRDPEECQTGGPWRFTTTHHGLVGWWRFDDGAGDRVRDWSGNGNDGTLMGESGLPIWDTTVRGGALLFDGIDDYVVVGDVEALDGRESISLETMFSTTTNGANTSLVAKWYTDPSSYTLRTEDVEVSTGRVSFSTQTTEGMASSTSDNPINDGAWHYIAGIYDGSAQWICLDGSCQETITTQSGMILNSSADLCFAAFCYPSVEPSLFFDGSLREIAAYDRPLMDAEVQANYCRLDWMGDICDD